MNITDEQLELLKRKVKLAENALTEIKDTLRDLQRGGHVNGTNGANGWHPPTIVEIAAYCGERNNHIDPQKFFDHYEARGWIPNGSKKKMSDWKAAVRTWENNNRRSNGSPGVRELFPVDPRGNLATARQILGRIEADENHEQQNFGSQ